MKVLLVTNMYPVKGRPVDGVFVAREAEAVAALQEDDIELSVLHVDTVGSRWRYISGIGAFRAKVARFRPDIVHVHHGLTQIICLPWAGPRVVTFHGSDLTLWWQRLLSSALLRLRPGTPVVVAPHLRDRLPAALRSGARVIGCGVDTALFRPMSDGARQAGALVIGFPSSPARPGKDYGLFSRTLEAVRAAGHEVRERVMEGVEPADMPGALNSLDVLLMTSVHEGSPVVTREALCCGTRVVSVDVGDVAEQLQGFSGCALVPTREPADLAAAVVSALREPAPDPTRAAVRFSLVRQARAVVNCYRDALAAHR